MSVLNGIVIGGAGGAIAGVTVWLVKYMHDKTLEWVHKRRVYFWLQKETSGEQADKFRSTRAIASWNNLTEDRVRYICSIHQTIFLSTGAKEDMWGIHDHGERSVYDERGVLKL